MAINWKSKVLLFKIETAYGTDPTPTGALNAILATQIRLSPMEGQDKSRELELPYHGAQPTIPTELHMKLAFRVEAKGSGTKGTAPSFGPLLRACGMAETIVATTSVTYNPISSGHEAGTFYLWIGGTLYKMMGSRGTATLHVDKQDIPYIEFEFTGLFTVASEVVRATPDLAAQLANKPKVANSASTPTFTINGVSLVMRSFAWRFANSVETRFLIGSESVLITDRADAIDATVEAVPLTTLNPYQLSIDQTTVALSLVHGTTAGKIMTVSQPALLLQRLTSLENQQNILEWPLKGLALPVSGNDQGTIVFT
ncbi:phage tail tube protein [Rhodobacter capsulatus]|uniref:phage tail tube protein n=1 Tax=Rhodobacter capsulatus TaxID=1061 RepID=UPI0040288A56